MYLERKSRTSPNTFQAIQRHRAIPEFVWFWNGFSDSYCEIEFNNKDTIFLKYSIFCIAFVQKKYC